MKCNKGSGQGTWRQTCHANIPPGERSSPERNCKRTKNELYHDDTMSRRRKTSFHHDDEPSKECTFHQGDVTSNENKILSREHDVKEC